MDYVLRSRLGYFTKKSEKSKTLKLSYFFIGNNYEIFYARKVAIFEKALSLSKSMRDLVAFLSKKTKQRSIQRFDLGDIKSYSQMEGLPNLNRLYFEMRMPKGSINTTFSEAVNKRTGKLRVLFMSAFYDENIGDVYSFLKGYHGIVNELKKAEDDRLPRKSQKDLSFFFQTFFYSPPSQIPKELEPAVEEMKKKMKLLQSHQTKGKKKTPETLKTKEIEISEFPEREEEKKELEANLEPTKDRNEKQTDSESKESRKSSQEDSHEMPSKEEEHPKIKKAEPKKGDDQLMRLPNNSMYAGAMNEGRTHGKGKEFLPDGSSYVGEFRSGMWHGKGYIVNSNLEMSYGEFMDGELVGI
jgi:hypothetical protein